MPTPLTHNTNLLAENGAQRTLDIRGKWINWLDGNAWKPISSSFVEVGNRWECRTGPLMVSVPKRSDRLTEMVAACQWDVFNKTPLTDPSFSTRVLAVGVSLVDAVPESSDTIAFPGAYPFGDLLYRMNFGRAPRCEKLVRINTRPSGTDDLRIEFILTPDAGKIATHDKPLNQRGNDDHTQIGIDLRNKLANNRSTIPEIMAENFRQKALRQRPIGVGRTSLTSAIGFRRNTGSLRGVGIKPAFAWDSSPEPILNSDGSLMDGQHWPIRIPITLEVERLANGRISVTKVVPRAFLDAAVYPVFTDTTTTFYPDPSAEVTSVDGYIYRTSDNSTWSSLRAGSGTTASDSTTNNSAIQTALAGTTNWGRLTRVIALFDTSAIGSGQTVNSATASFYGAANSEVGSNSASSNICASTPASNTSLSTGDYLNTGTTKYCDTDISYAAYSITAYNDYAMNATGIAAVSLTGITKLSFKNANYDIANTAPTRYSNTTQFRTSVQFAEDTSGSKDPKLVVDYTAVAGGPGMTFKGGTFNSGLLLGGRTF